MQKIISLFQRNYDGDRLVRDEVVPGSNWVLAGGGRPTEKIDGTCCMVRDGLLYKRFDAKRGKKPPVGFEPAQPECDPVTGHWPGWVLVTERPEDQWHLDAKAFMTTFLGAWSLPDGTYELVGPKIQGNPYRIVDHMLLKHGEQPLPNDLDPRTYADIWEFLVQWPMEGIVWHHPDGRMCKIKSKDFGLPWPDPDYSDELCGGMRLSIVAARAEGSGHAE